MQSAEELQSNLAEYKAQKEQVEQLLLLDDSNAEYQELNSSLAEVIELTEELLREAQQTAAQPSAPGASSHAAESAAATAPVAVQTMPPAVSSFLPPQVAQQIRAAQQKAALSGQAPAGWAIGAQCQAVWSGDSQWYNATVDGVSAAGNFIVSFDDDGGTEEVDRASVRAAPEADQPYRGVSAPTRKKVEDEPVVTEMPKWLEIQPEDDEKTRAKKKKLIKSYKSKLRFQKMDAETKNRQSSWQNFQKGKVSKKKPKGFLTGIKKGSMFSVPEGDNAKVGVIGSGKAMTEYHQAKPVKGRPDFGA